MGINSHPGSTYGPVQDMDMGAQFEDMPPAPPQDNNQVRSQKSVLSSVLINGSISGCRLVWHWPLESILGGTLSWWPVTPSVHLPIKRKQTSKTFQTCWYSYVIYTLVLNFYVFVCECAQSEFFIAWKIQCLSQKWKIKFSFILINHILLKSDNLSAT